MKLLLGGGNSFNGSSVSKKIYVATLRRNVVANLAGGGWVAVLTLAITPVQISLLGMEAYGLIGFITTLQIMMGVLDLGLTSTITRELAGDTSPGRQASRPLLRTALTFYWGIALLIGGGLFVCAEGVSIEWFNPQAVSHSEITKGLQVAAFILALRWPVALYSGALAGVQRMDVLNLVKAAIATLRLVGGMLIVLVWRDLATFLVWVAFSALVEVLLYAAICRRILPELDWHLGFSAHALKNIWGFSLSMNGLALLGMGITQLDRLLISKMLPLESLGYYSLAYNTATAISLVLSALSSALMPSFATAYAENARETLLQRYDIANRVALFGTGLVSFSIVFFGEPLLSMWVNPAAARGAWCALAFLAGGFWFSAAVSSAYNIGVACRRPAPLLKISAMSAVIYVPVLYGMIFFWGIEGAAAAWLLLNAGYVFVIVPMVHRIILGIPVMPWFSRTLFPFAFLGAAVFGSARVFANCLLLTAGLELFLLIPAVIVYAGIGYFFLGSVVRTDLIKIFQRIFRIQ